MTVGQMLDRWLAEVGPEVVRAATWENRRAYVEHYIKPDLGAVALQELTRTEVEAFYRRLARAGRARGPGGLAPASVHSVHLALHAALAWAVERRLVGRNVADGAHRRGEPAEPEAWTAEELGAFLQVAADDALYPLWRLLAMGGLRLGEALGLRWCDVDVARARVVVRQTRSKGVDGRLEVGVPKTRRGRRSVDLDPTTVEVLATSRPREAAADGLAFRQPGSATPLHPDGVRSRFARLVRAAGVRRLTPHGLRDTHATLLLEQGEALHVVSRRLGHANEAFTARRYAAVLPGQQAQAAARLADRLAPEPGEEDED